MLADRSTAMTRPRGSLCSRCSVSRPLPQPRSSAVSSPRRSSEATIASPHDCIGLARRSYACAFHSVTRGLWYIGRMLWVKLVAGVLLGLVGLVFLGQGLGFIPGSFMTGQAMWAIIGAVLVIVAAW